MNIVLFTAEEVGCPIPVADPRAEHIVTVLRRKVGDEFDAGVVNGPIGKGRVVGVQPAGIEWTFAPKGSEPAEELAPIELIIGLPRPQTARKILQEATALGVRGMRFVQTEKGEVNYAQSTLWSTGEWKRHVRAGLEQAFATREPTVTVGRSLEQAWEEMGLVGDALVLDNYEAAAPLGASPVTPPVALVIGGERGWSGKERDFFRVRGARLVHLGHRVLRTETACVAAVAIVRSRLGF